MSVNIEELDYQLTSLGELILRRRRFPILGESDVFEVILNDEFLMSSLFTTGEIALAELGLAYCKTNKIDMKIYRVQKTRRNFENTEKLLYLYFTCTLPFPVLHLYFTYTLHTLYLHCTATLPILYLNFPARAQRVFSTR